MKSKAIKEFTKIYENEFGIKLTFSEANSLASKFLNLFNRVINEIENKSKKGDDSDVTNQKKRAQRS
ncbi:MAG: hypothetical protein HRT47_12210 [Candidatus Caenarcaniphilales bacterium]|nr:hypothetical protein [Candidatus Caenarcaniphilales bacterium]